MYIYLFVLVVSILLARITLKKQNVLVSVETVMNHTLSKQYKIEKQYKITSYLLVSIPFILLSGFRSGIGTDVATTYTNAFNNVLNESTFFVFSPIELSENLLMFMSGKLFTSLNFFLFANAIVVCFCFFYSSYKLRTNIYLSILFFFFGELFFSSLNNVRSMSAICICFLAFTFVIERKFYYFIFFVAVATTFHQSAIMSLVLYPLINFNFFRKKEIILIVLLLLSVPILFNILVLILQNTKYVYFLQSFIMGNDRMGVLTIFITFLNFIVSFYVYRKEKNNYNYAFLITNLCSVTIILLSFFIKSNELTTRLNSFFLYYNFLMYPKLFNDRKSEFKQISIYLLIFYVFICFYHVQQKGYYDVIPYKSSFFM